MSATQILAVRLGAMGDIIHTLPAVASLKAGYPGCHLTWAVEPRWIPLLKDNPSVDEVLPIDRGSMRALLDTRKRLRMGTFSFAVDFQGLLKSAIVARLARPCRIYGLSRSAAREPLAAALYTHRCTPHAVHVVEQRLELAALAGATTSVRHFFIPPGEPEGRLPKGPFILANPIAGWGSKQWPLSHYAQLARLLRNAGYEMVLNGTSPLDVPETVSHVSGLPGLIDATRRAVAVVGVDSGPLHLAAALGKPGVAIFGPTDPDRNGPCGGSIQTLRARDFVTSYQRGASIDISMTSIAPEQVWAALEPQLPCFKL